MQRETKLNKGNKTMQTEHNYTLPAKREQLTICDKGALLHHLNKIEEGINNLNLEIYPNNKHYNELRNRVSNLINNVKKYS